jgi:hypothetical protein
VITSTNEHLDHIITAALQRRRTFENENGEERMRRWSLDRGTRLSLPRSQAAMNDQSAIT